MTDVIVDKMFTKTVHKHHKKHSPEWITERILTSIPADGRFHSVGDISRLTQLPYMTVKRYVKIIDMIINYQRKISTGVGKGDSILIKTENNLPANPPYQEMKLFD